MSHICPASLEIENHSLLVIASDSFDVQPAVVDAVISLPGERYDFVVHANQTEGRLRRLLVTQQLRSTLLSFRNLLDKIKIGGTLRSAAAWAICYLELFACRLKSRSEFVSFPSGKNSTVYPDVRRRPCKLLFSLIWAYTERNFSDTQPPKHKVFARQHENFVHQRLVLGCR